MQIKNKNSILLYHKFVIMQEVVNMIDPCKMCYLHPHDCPNRNGCKSRLDYLKEVDKDIPIISKKKKRVFDNNYNKNGIWRS